MPQQWHRLWEMLPNKSRRGPGWDPPLPLILGAWWEASDAEKKGRLELHLEWAAKHGDLKRVSDFLMSLPENEWHHVGE